MKTSLIWGFLLVLVIHVSAQNWKASWITAQNVQNVPNTWICFRKTVTVDSVPGQALTQIATDTKYWLWINEKLVIFEGGLKRGPNPLDTYYDEVDIAPYLQKGNNTVAVLVWYMGKDGFSHVSSGKAGLLFQCITPNFEIVTNQSWKSSIHQAFGTSGGVQPNFRLSESSISFNAQKDLGGWQSSTFKGNWNNAFEYGLPPVYPWNNLVLRPIPQWKNSGLKSYGNLSKFPIVSSEDTIVGHLPSNIHVTPYLKIDAPEGLTIDIRTDNFNGGSEPNVRAEYTTKKGIQEFECFGWMNGQKVIYSIPKGVRILDLKYRETGYDTDFSGSFSCSDEFYNRLWKKALRTLYVTMRDNYMDCPDRERAQWWGDEVVEGGEAFYALCPKSHKLFRKGIYELIGWQKKDGSLFSPIPAGNWNQELPSQMLASIGYLGFWNYYMHTDDKQTIADNYPGVKRYLDIWKFKDDGTLVYRQGGWPWGDWGTEVDIELIENAWYQLALMGAKNMAHLLEKTEDEAVYVRQMDRFKEAFNKSFWNGKEYRHYNYKGKTDDRAQALAVLAGLADKDKYPAIFELFKTQEYASPYMEKYIMEALFQMGYEDYALNRTKSRFNEMVNHPDYTTLFEGWGIGSKGFGGGTWNHAWSGGVLTVLMQYVCGIAPVEPGYSKFQVMPQPGSLKHASASVLSVKGWIKTSFSNQASGFRLSLSVPSATTSIAGIPASNVNQILLNGRTIWKNGAFVENKNVINGFSKGKFICFEIGKGDWNFESFRMQ
ncbi:MAG: alpha-L-rhamnosidase C-terminal domain-containing protein [Bacteroidota bacterium]|nr:alpha-L-rhamnosidase C-terminal domain-containing protein [Bacteroidota bacterium]